MSWFSRFTRFGDVHLVYAQEEDNSCGIACVMMAVFKTNKIALGKTAVTVEKNIYKVYEEVSGSTYDGTQYSTATNLAKALNKLKCGTWEAKYIGPGAVAGAIVKSLGVETPGQSLLAGGGAPAAYVANQLKPIKPIILLVGWNAGGAHFVVVDVVNETPWGTYASVCDPWDGNVHITKFKVGSNFNYNGAKVPLSWDLGGKKHDYSTTSKGSPNGWVIRRIN